MDGRELCASVLAVALYLAGEDGSVELAHLRKELAARGFGDDDLVDAALTALAREGLLSFRRPDGSSTGSTDLPDRARLEPPGGGAGDRVVAQLEEGRADGAAGSGATSWKRR